MWIVDKKIESVVFLLYIYYNLHTYFQKILVNLEVRSSFPGLEYVGLIGLIVSELIHYLDAVI